MGSEGGEWIVGAPRCRACLRERREGPRGQAIPDEFVTQPYPEIRRGISPHLREGFRFVSCHRIKQFEKFTFSAMERRIAFERHLDRDKRRRGLLVALLIEVF